MSDFEKNLWHFIAVFFTTSMMMWLSMGIVMMLGGNVEVGMEFIKTLTYSFFAGWASLMWKDKFK